jgi:hypothetical protein
MSDAAATFSSAPPDVAIPGGVDAGECRGGRRSVLLFTVSWKVLLITLIAGCLLDRLLAVPAARACHRSSGQFAGR